MASLPNSLTSKRMENAMLVGYARVSTQDQDLSIQRERLAHCEKLFAETASALIGFQGCGI